MSALELKRKRMEHHTYGNLWGFIPGILGGLYKYGHPLQITTWGEAFERLLPAFFTALLCGIAGAIGKWLFDIVRDFIKRKIK